MNNTEINTTGLKPLMNAFGIKVNNGVSAKYTANTETSIRSMDKKNNTFANVSNTMTNKSMEIEVALTSKEYIHGKEKLSRMPMYAKEVTIKLLLSFISPTIFLAYKELTALKKELMSDKTIKTASLPMV
nr:hypothetical protein [Bacillus sp. UNCCL13]